MPELILNTDDLLRRVIFNNPSYVKEDQSLSSFAFRPRSNEVGVSVDISRLTTYQKSIRDKFNYRLYSVKASFVRDIGLDCHHDPIEDNNSHALITGNFTNSNCKKLARGATRVPYPD